VKNGKGIDAQLAKLNREIEAKHAEFRNGAAAAINSILVEYGLTLDDLITAKTPKPAKATKAAKPANGKTAKRKREPAFKGPQPPKYREPDSGATWSGFGRAPAWIAGAKNRDAFLIQ
jgi:DNA-binding protein H-NS